jgi:alkylation response protein AidB-like acyl-CoA dehydrogenase
MLEFTPSWPGMTWIGCRVILGCMNEATTPTTRRENAGILIERARSLVPALRQRSAQATAERRLARETIDDIRRLELTRCLQPSMFGGFASDYRMFSKMLRTLSQGCGSTAWVCAVHGEHNWVIGNFSEQAQRDVWGPDPQAVASASVPPSGTAETIAGGHRLSGRWGFASGVDHAQWLLLNAVAQSGGKPQERLFLIPVGQAEIVDDWHVMGLCGTGSKSVVVKDAIVAATHSVSMHELKTGAAPGAAVHPGHPLYGTPRSLLASFSLSSVNVGLAERAVEEFTAFTRDRRSRGLRVADLEAVQLAVAEAAAQAETAAMLVEQTIDSNIRLVESGAPITAERVAWTRRNSSYATQLSHAAVSSIFQVAGGTALYAGNPLQEIFRDTMAASAHLSLTWHRAAPAYGQIRLGLPVDFDTL